jgi:hypothetical protein
MIDIRQERPLPLGLVDLPSSIPGRKVCRSTLYRWACKGLLEVVRIGGRTYTSEAALQRLVERQNAGRDWTGHSREASAYGQPAQAARAGAELDRMLVRTKAPGSR